MAPTFTVSRWSRDQEQLGQFILSGMTDSFLSNTNIVSSPLIDTFYNTGQIRFAFAIPAKGFMNRAAMRNAPCYAWVVTQCGCLWILQSQGQAWDLDALVKTTDLLSIKIEKLDWPSLTFALTDLEIPPLTQVVGPRLPIGLGAHLVDTGRVTHAFMSQWLAGKRNLETVSPRAVQDQLKRYIDERLSETISEFRHVACESLSVTLDSAMDLDINNGVASSRSVERRQFLTLFPVLASKVFAHDASQFWRGLRSIIDDRKSVVKTLAKSLEVRPSAVRSLTGVGRDAVGEYFFDHMEELIRILDQIAVEHHPASPSMWAAFCSSYTSAKEVFGHSVSARLVIVARLKSDLKWLAKSGSVRDPGYGVDEARLIDQFRQGLIGTVLVAGCASSTAAPHNRLSKAAIHSRVDRYLGTLSWQRLVALSNKWSQSLAKAVQSRTVELEFLQSRASFYDFLGGTFLASNGYQVETLTNAAALRRQGDAMGICLRNASNRSDYADACARGRTTILSICNAEHRKQSTLELGVRLASDADVGDKVHFDVLQHQGSQNNPAPQGAWAAASEMFKALAEPNLQTRAVQGIRLSAAKPRGVAGVETVNLTLTVAGREAFDLTFGTRSKGIWQLLQAVT